MHEFLALFLYKVLALISVILWMIAANKWLHVSRRNLHYHIIRSFFSVFGTVMMFISVKHVSISDVVAILSLGPVFTIVIGSVLFVESITFHKVISVVLSFLGVMHILYPSKTGAWYLPSTPMWDATMHNPYVLMLLLGLMSWVVTSLVVKKISYTETASNQLFFNLLFTTFFSAVLLLCVFLLSEDSITMPSIANATVPIRAISAAAVFYLIHCVARFQAYKMSDLSIVLPFHYTKMIFGGMIAYMIDGEEITSSSIIGSAFILTGGLILTLPQFTINMFNKRNK